MANVQQDVEQILAARYGEEVRGSIADAILSMNDESAEAHRVAIDSQDSSQRNAQAAALSATNAKISEDNAKTSELNAKDSEIKAKASETNAKTSEDNAKDSEVNAKVSETNAKTSETNAKTSEDNAKTSETNANNSSASALQSATSASASASAASNSQTAASNSASAAKVSEDNARQYAEQASAIANIDVATVSRNGISRPDGSSIGINQFGVLSAIGLTDHINTNLDDPDGVHGTRIYNDPATGKKLLQRWNDATSDWEDVAGALDPATKDTIGGVIVGSGLDITEEGTLSTKANGRQFHYENGILTINEATRDNLGVVKLGDGIDRDPLTGTISVNFGNNLEYDEDDSLLYLKNGDKILSQVEIGGGTPATIVHVTTTETAWKGNPDVTISLSDGAVAYTGTFDENGDFSHKVKNLGEHTAVVTESGKTYTGTVDVTSLGGTYFIKVNKIANGKTVIPINDVKTWLSCLNGGSAYSYTTISQVIADNTLLSNILADDNSNDYLVRSTSFASTMCSDSATMTLIGNINACANKLLLNSDWSTAICNSIYFEKVLNKKVPTMTSETQPSGQAISGGDLYYTNYNWHAFDGNDSTSGYGSTTHENGYIGYKFTKPTKVYLVNYLSNPTFGDRSIKNYKLQCSDNGTNWEDAKVGSFEDSPEWQIAEVDNPPSALYWRVFYLDYYGGSFVGVMEMQFYGREEV